MRTVEGAKHRARRMALLAMGEMFTDVATSGNRVCPCKRTGFGWFKKQPAPDAHGKPGKRNGDSVGEVFLRNRLKAAQESDQSSHIFIRHSAQGRIRHDWTHDRAIRFHPPPDRVDDFPVRPVADTVDRVGCDIGPVKPPVRSLKRSSTRIDRPIIGRMAATSAGQGKYIPPVGDEVRGISPDVLEATE